MKKTPEEKIKYKRIQRRKNTTFVLFLVVLLVLITIGYASLATVLNINGNTTVGKLEWNIHFQNVQEVDRNCNIVESAHIVDAEQTLVEYTIKLEDLKDRYEFTVDVVNTGTLDGILESAVLGGLTSDARKYLNYTVTYADGTAITNGAELDHGDSVKLRVIVEFKDDLTKDDLPSDEETFTLTYQMKYVQK